MFASGTGGQNTSYVETKLSEPAPAGGCKVEFGVEPQTAVGHSHGIYPPDKAGKVSPETCTIPAGKIMCQTMVAYTSGEISGGEKIIATLVETQQEASASISVLVKGLVLMPVSGLNPKVWRLTGHTGNHPNNHYGTPNTVTRIGAMATDYFNFSDGFSIGINDMSLIWGGLFDLGPDYGGLFWSSPPHTYHRIGKSVDIDQPGVDQRLLTDKAKAVSGTRIKEGKRCPTCIHYEFP